MAFKTLYFISLCHIVNGISNLNQTVAREQCKGHGGLASYRHFIENDERNLEEHLSLSDGESAWISGNVKFSNFVAWHGCYTIDKGQLRAHKLAENNINNCLENCGDMYNIIYIGIRNEWCYCIDDTHIRYSILKVIPDNECKQQLIEPNFVSIHDDSSTAAISVYSIIETRRLDWNHVTPPPFAQCVYAWIENNKEHYKADSCFTLQAGFVCISSVHQPINCSAVHGDIYQGGESRSICLATKSSSWLSAYKECGRVLGKLAIYVYSEIKGAIKPNATVWTGIFRSFKLDDADALDNISVCLSLKKINGRFLLDPADCSIKKEYICGDDISKNTDSTLRPTYSHQETKLVTESSYSTTAVTEKNTTFSVTVFPLLTTMSGKEKENANGKTGQTDIYIAIGAVVSIVVFAIGITCFILRKRRKLCKRDDNNSPKNNHKTAGIDSKVSAGSATVSHGDAQGQVLKHQHNESAKENEYAIPDTVMIQRSATNGEYDRVDMNVPGKSNDNAVSVMLANANVYGVHTGIGHNDCTDEYDHIRAVGTKQMARPVDGIYNTMSAESDTYNVLRLDTKEKTTDQPNDKRSNMDEACSTYDKLD